MIIFQVEKDKFIGYTISDYKDYREAMMKKLMLKVILPLWYKLCCIRKIEKTILFLEVRGEKMSSDFNVVLNELKKDEEFADYKISTHYLTLDRGTRIKYIKQCILLMPKLASAKYAMMNEGSTVIGALKLRSGTKLIQIWHGAGALKKFGYSAGDDKQYFSNESIVAVSSEKVRTYYSEAMGLAKEKIYGIGVPHTDLYFKDGFVKHCQYLREKLTGDAKKKIILYAPTYRGSISNPKDAQGLNLDLMYKHLGQEYIVISKLHNALKPVRRNYRHREFYMDMSGKWSIEEALMVSDILITDYSALVFDYALLSKPAVFYAYDLEEYEKAPGLFLDYRKIMPGEIVNSTMEIIKEIKNGCFNVTKMTEFKNTYMDGCDGQAAKR